MQLIDFLIRYLPTKLSRLIFILTDTFCTGWFLRVTKSTGDLSPAYGARQSGAASSSQLQ
jgi:hypothetical protein